MPEGDKLLVITDDGSWRTKRIRNTPRVTIQKCGALDKVMGEPVEAVARMLPKSETRRVFDKIVKRYWNHAFYFVPQAVLRGGIDTVHAAIEIQAVPPTSDV
ncbi:PPOX class probable F420-dependent enzyme, Rv2061 family [Nocardia africana]|uniref:PPOX class probable F420-dependent enzyme, Rv2061 family n=1 Tax=Nocardia africana TaxID=134964 RepID=A0A378WSM3_9NOCA|nr:PPOX class probable F420-dependent enzyme, Rv2061 family [Nocardia africana]